MEYEKSKRYGAAVAAFVQASAEDPQEVHDEAAGAAGGLSAVMRPYSLIYHRTLSIYVKKLDPEPSEALSLASYCQHIRRWKIPRSEYPDGLAGYKSWRFNLNKFHVATAHEILEQVGYNHSNPEDEKAIFKPISDLLMKKTLKGGNDKGDKEMQVFEDAICLTFLELEFATFSQKHDEDKMVAIVQKTWAKMGHQGREYAVEHLANSLPSEAKGILERALASP